MRYPPATTWRLDERSQRTVCVLRLNGACLDLPLPIKIVRKTARFLPFEEASPGVYTSSVDVTFPVGPILSAAMETPLGLRPSTSRRLWYLRRRAGLTSGPMAADLTRYCEGVLDCAGVCDGDGYLNECGDCESPDRPAAFADSFDMYDDTIWDVLPGTPTHTYAGGALQINGDAGFSTTVPMRSETTHNVQSLGGSFNKNDSCSDHFVMLSPRPDATFDWGSAPMCACMELRQQHLHADGECL